MMKRLEGKNLKHPGCLIGVTIGLIVGIILAGILALVANISLPVLIGIWFGLAILLGAIGWIIGSQLTAKATRSQTLEEIQIDNKQSSGE